MFIIGIDPHKGSHTAAVIDRDEQLVGELSVRADRSQRGRSLRWAREFEPRVGATVDHVVTSPGIGRSAWFKDPDGNTIALFQPE